MDGAESSIRQASKQYAHLSFGVTAKDEEANELPLAYATQFGFAATRRYCDRKLYWKPTSSTTAASAKMVTVYDTTSPDGDYSPDTASKAGGGGSDYAEDVIIRYMGSDFPCDSSILCHGSGAFRQAMEGREFDATDVGPISSVEIARNVTHTFSQLAIFQLETFPEYDSREVFYAVLETMYSGGELNPNSPC